MARSVWKSVPLLCSMLAALLPAGVGRGAADETVCATRQIEAAVAAKTGANMPVRLLWPARCCPECEVLVLLPDHWRTLQKPRGSAQIRDHGKLVGNVPFEVLGVSPAAAAGTATSANAAAQVYRAGSEVKVVYRNGDIVIENAGKLGSSVAAGAKATVLLQGQKSVSGTMHDDGVVYVQ